MRKLELTQAQMTAYMSLPTDAPIETVLRTLEADLRSDKPATADEMTTYHADALRKALSIGGETK